MSFRTVVINKRCKLDLKTNYLVCRSETEVKVFIPEISVIILESTAISLTSALISELVKNNVKIIFCDEKHNPESEVCSYYGSFNCPKKLVQQINWKNETKQKIWQTIIKLKIEKQMKFLQEIGAIVQSEMLEGYLGQVLEGDSTNREGHSAKVYFNSLFGLEHNRRNENFINGALNYGYSILISIFNREIVKNGYLTQLGVWHCNEFNEFNLTCDILEPFRIIIDKIVYYNIDENDTNFKGKILEIFNMQFKIDNKLQYFENVVSIYCQSVFKALEQDNENLIRCYE